jgi:hypothetical protein
MQVPMGALGTCCIDYHLHVLMSNPTVTVLVTCDYGHGHFDCECVADRYWRAWRGKYQPLRPAAVDQRIGLPFWPVGLRTQMTTEPL